MVVSAGALQAEHRVLPAGPPGIVMEEPPSYAARLGPLLDSVRVRRPCLLGRDVRCLCNRRSPMRSLCHGHQGASRRVIDSRAEVVLGVLPAAPQTLGGWDPQVDALRRAQQSVTLFLRHRVPAVVAELVEIRDSLARGARGHLEPPTDARAAFRTVYTGVTQ